MCQIFFWLRTPLKSYSIVRQLQRYSLVTKQVDNPSAHITISFQIPPKQSGNSIFLPTSKNTPRRRNSPIVTLHLPEIGVHRKPSQINRTTSKPRPSISLLLPQSTHTSMPISLWQREEREDMRRKAQAQREQAVRKTKPGLDLNVPIKQEEYTLD